MPNLPMPSSSITGPTRHNERNGLIRCSQTAMTASMSHEAGGTAAFVDQAAVKMATSQIADEVHLAVPIGLTFGNSVLADSSSLSRPGSRHHMRRRKR